MMNSAPPIESRIAVLEKLLGISGTVDNTSPTSDINSRIDLLLSKSDQAPGTALSPPASLADRLGEDLAICDRLFQKLNPGSALTHQGAASFEKPFLYRRQEVLASRDSLREDLDRLGRIRDLILASTTAAGAAANLDPQPVPLVAAGGKVGARSGSAGPKSQQRPQREGGQSSAERFVNSSLLTSDRYGYACESEALRRLNAVTLKVSDVSRRASEVMTTVDDLIVRYHKMMTAVSEKLVLADEELAARRL